MVPKEGYSPSLRRGGGVNREGICKGGAGKSNKWDRKMKMCFGLGKEFILNGRQGG